MNIAFDATALLADMSRGRGIGNYSSALFEQILNMDQESQYYCLNLFNSTLKNEWEEKYENFQEIQYYSGERIELLRLPEYKQILGKIVEDFLEAYDIDIFLITSLFDPAVSIYERKWFGNVRVVSIVHDIIPYLFKELYFTTYAIQKKYMEQLKALQWMDMCLANSEATKNDIVRYSHIASEKVVVIGGAADQRVYRKLDLSIEEKQEIRNRYEIADEFFICVGGEDPRKNMQHLIQAYLGTVPEVRERYQLVIVCRLSEKVKEYYHSMEEEYHTYGRIVLTGFIPESDLVKLYNISTALLFPSRYEGFGLPVVEAWNCGTAVLASDNSSLKEIGKGAALLVDAGSIEKITKGIEQISDQEMNRLYRERGTERVKQYTWENTAQKALYAIRQLPPQIRHGKKDIRRVALFTPLPPMKSGISDYSYDIVCEISRYFDIDVFIDNGYEANALFPQNVNVYGHYEFMEKASEYDEIVYQVGNSPFHCYMYDYIKEYPGIVVLHDLNLHGTLNAVTGLHVGRRFQRYKEALLEDLTKAEMNDYICRRLSNYSDSWVNNNPFNGFVVNHAKKVIVHSNYAKEQLLKRNVARDVAVIPHYAKIAEEQKKCEREIINIAAFGLITRAKRPIAVLNAFKKLVNEGYSARLFLVGSAEDELRKELEGHIAKNCLQEQVKLTGYVSLDDFEKYMEMSDICLNLRYPYMGENSGTAARLLGMGKCIIVNDVGSFSDLPNGACLKLPSVEQMTEKEEVDRILEAVKLAMNPEIRVKIGQNAYQYAQKELNIQRIGELYRDVIDGVWKRVYTNYELHKLLEQGKLVK